YQRIGRPLVDMQVGLGDIVLITVTRGLVGIDPDDVLAQLVDRVGCRQHGRRVGADQMHLAIDHVGDIRRVADDGVMQHMMLVVMVAQVDRGQNVAMHPGGAVLDQQYRCWAITQQLPVIRGQQGFFQGVIRQVLLDYQPAALGSQGMYYGLGQVGVPRLGITGRDAGGFQPGAQLRQQRFVVVAVLACQQMQLGTDESGNQPGSYQRYVVFPGGVDDHQYSFDGLHGFFLFNGACRCWEPSDSLTDNVDVFSRPAVDSDQCRGSDRVPP